MPELPEVESFRRKMEKGLKNKKIEDVYSNPDAIVFAKKSAAFVKNALLGATVKGSGRKGKYFWLKLNQKPWPLFHLGMTGSILITDELPDKKQKSIKLILEMNDGTFMVFKDPRRFGRILFLEDPMHSKPVSQLGFDVQDELPSAKELYEMLQKRRAPIKAVLLDQSVFAGVGNWMADEILFQAKLLPQRLAQDLSKAEVALLRSKTASIVKRAVILKAADKEYPQTWLFQHRWGRKNYNTFDGDRISHGTVAGRSTAWVESIQK
jgi:formamidopyrimidine-DNA glycosylase